VGSVAAAGMMLGTLAISSNKSSKIVKGAEYKVYPGAPHGLTSTLKDQFHADLLAFLRSWSSRLPPFKFRPVSAAAPDGGSVCVRSGE
jgi:hypothetical protein